MTEIAIEAPAPAPANAITPSSILDHVNELVKECGTEKDSSEILDLLLEIIPIINFREEANLGEDEKIKTKHSLIIVIEKLLEIARINNWGLCRNLDFIYLYNSGYWELITKDQLKDFLGKCAEKFGVDKYDARHFRYKDELRKQFESSANLPRPQRTNAQLINLSNGTFVVSNKGNFLREYNRDDFLTYKLPFNYNSNSIAPLFHRYINQVLPAQELRDVLSEYIGYVFLKGIQLSKVLILLGGGANGKSVFFDIVTALIGHENVSNYSLQSLTDSSGYYRAAIANKLLNYASEINGKLEASIFKQLASGEPIEARLPYGNPMIIKSYARMMFNCNELPKDVEFTHAFFRRFLIIPFDVTIAKEDQDPDLAKKIIENELSGVFNWVLEGVERLLKNKKFTHSIAIDKVLNQYTIDSDSVRSFLQDKEYAADPHDYILSSDLYRIYKEYCFDDGLKALGKKNFKKRLESIGIQVGRKNIGNVVYVKKSKV